MELTAEQQEKIKGFAERYFCKDENIKVLSFNNLNDDVLIQLNRKKALFSFSPYDINKFAKDIYILGFQIYLGWEFIFFNIYDDIIEIRFKLLELN